MVRWARGPDWRGAALLTLLLAALPNAAAQSVGLHGDVTDPSGAVIAGTTIVLSDQSGNRRTAISDRHGDYSIAGVDTGVYILSASANGFAEFHKENIRIDSHRSLRFDIPLTISVDQQQVTVNETGNTLSADPASNADAMILRGDGLLALSDDPSELQSELQAMAGPSPGSDGGQTYVDGFGGATTPPRSAIREIRISQDPYSAEYDRAGYGRVEIFTKPGTQQLHGGFMAMGNDSSFNARNPFAGEEPPYYSTLFYGDVSGPIDKRASWFLNVDRGNLETNAIVNAVVLDSSFNQVDFSQALAAPRTNTDVSPRIDLQLGQRHSLTVRYQLDRAVSQNAGVGQFALASQGYDMRTSVQTLQIADTQVYNPKTVNDTRFQYIRYRNNQSAQSSDPTIAVPGAFTSGGSNAGSPNDHQDRYELQDSVLLDLGKHYVKFGGRVRVLRDANVSNAGFNGAFVFSSLEAYQITQQGIAEHLSPAQIRVAGGGATQFSISNGTPAIVVALADAGLYIEDSWKLRPNLTLSYGLRYERQNRISDNVNFAPRAGIAWGLSRKGSASKTVLRAGYGWFYTRFGAQYVLTEERQDGRHQQSFVAASPDFYPSIPPLNTLASEASETIYETNPALRAPNMMQASMSIDRQLARGMTLSLSYLNTRGIHQLLLRNINSPLPGTYDPQNPASGERPLGGDQNIYQYTSEGVFRQNQLFANLRVSVGAKLSLYGYYAWNDAHANTAGAGSFPSDEYDLRADYGRAAYDVRHRFFLGGTATLPYGLQISPFVTASSGQPFNIVLGQDRNGDAQFNDRPTFATDLSRSSVVQTAWGTFDAEPIPGQKVIPNNYGTGPPQFAVNLRVGKSVSFGPELGGGPSSLQSNTSRKTSPHPLRRFILSFDISAQNVFNRVNLTAPEGTLGSPLFGKSNAIVGSSSANRLINLQTVLRF